MAPFRNFLARKSQPNGTDPDGWDEARLSPNPQSSPVAIRNEDRQPPEYKLSVVNDSGVYLPPSPPEKQSFWSRQTGPKRTTNHRNLVDENEPFSISRESFDSYRRSFDISARSPVIHADAPSRTSLDSRFSRIASPSMRSTSFEKPDPMEEEVFEDVGLTDENKPKKKGFLSRFGDSSDSPSSGTKTSTPFGFHLPGSNRKRGQSGTGSELNPMQTPNPAPQPATGSNE